jgi:methylated-DNA-protein-cysteine methyltransferase-like protein
MSFTKRVEREIRRIPRGTTRSYGEIAFRAGKPRAPRAVVAALRVLMDVPWWRVARRDGTFAPQVAREQEALLRQEGWKPPRKLAPKSARKPARKPPPKTARTPAKRVRKARRTIPRKD